MTLPATPPITLAQVRAEFVAPAATPLHAFVRGGAWVPDNATNAGVPSAAPIALHQLCGAANYTPISNVTANPNPSSASRTLIGRDQPQIVDVSGSIAISATGGNGNYSYLTTFVSGTAMNVLNGNTANPSIDANCARNQTISAVYRFTVSDGTSSLHVDVTVTRTYAWDSGV